MASRQKQSEGISLLSMYNDEDDEEMEDVDDQEHGNGEEQQQIDERNEYGEPEQVEAMATDGSPNEVAPRVNSTRTDSLVRPTTPQQQQQVTQVSSPRRRKRGRLTIVDYGHDEVAMSPEHEEGEFGEEMQYTNGVVQENTQSGTVQVLTPGIEATPFSSENLEQSQNAEFNNRIVESESVDVEDASKGPAENVDALDKFLPPPTKEKCPEELQRRIEKFIALKKVGRSFNAEVRNKKDYRNPDFLLHAVRYQDIDQIGSCFSKDVFDPHGYDKSDYYDEIEADMRRDKERKEQELKRSPRVDFIPGGTQPGTVIPASKFSMPVPVGTSSGLPTIADTAPRDSRPNKKSKWDKVDGDVRSTLPPAGQDSLAAAAAHAALLSAANVGAGYTAYVQQKRREAEERRSSERKLERRS